jgi:arylsulfate sulfotransferase
MNSARCTLLALVSLIGVSTQLNATTIYLGSGATGTNPQIQVLDTSGTFLGNFGANPSSAAALDGAGHVFTVTPGDTSSTIYVYNEAQAELANFLFTAGIDNGNGFPNYLTDLTWDGSNLWASSYNGEIYQVSSTGTLLSSFDTGIVDTGVTTDGTYLYTTSGLGLLGPASLIYKWDFQGNLVDTIDTGLNDTLGIGYDKSTSTFYVGGVDVVSQVAADGSVLNAFANDGYHGGLEVGDVGTLPPDGGVPEPATLALTGAGILAVAWLRKPRQKNRIVPLLLVAGVLVAGKGSAAPTISGVAGAPGSAIPVGTKVTLTTSASDTDAGALRYRYRVNYNSGAYATVVDYGPSATFNWTPATVEGSYTVEVSVINRSTGSTVSTTVPVSVSSRVIGGTPVVSSTSHPLVALYSAPPCAAGVMRVRFKTASQVYWQSTSTKPCNGQTSMNFYVAGMYANTTYTLRSDVINGPRVTTSGDLTFTTGALGVTLPATSVSIPLPPTASMTEGFTLFMPLGAPAYAVDKDANPVWYLPGTVAYGTRIAPGVSSAGSPADASGATITAIYGLTADLANSGFRELDLAGNIIKDTNTEQLNAVLASKLLPFTLNGVHHEVRRLPDGRYLLLGMTEVMSDAQGPNTDILGDVIVVLDKDLQVLWYWNAFDHLDVTRKAVLGETCTTGAAGCVVFNAPVANDWTHGNSVAVAPDGNIVYSSRHQDFVYKIAFQNGTGDGHVIWRLGKDGDFTWNSGDPYPWQSHQHDVEYEGNSKILSLFDNGNTRYNSYGGNSRGQALQLDENAMSVTPIINADLGAFSAALGSAQKLSNGNYSFGSGFVTPTQSLEVNKAGAIVGRIDKASYTYRTFRLRDLYSGSW